MSSAMSSTQARTGTQDDDEAEVPEESPHSKLYNGFIQEIIEHIRSNHPLLIADTDAELLALFGTFSNDAQMFLTCLIMRKDLKWHPSWRLIKLGQRLSLDETGIGRVIGELSKIPPSYPAPTGAQFFAEDESQMTIDERLRCLRLDHLREILRDSKRAGKDEMIAALKQSGRDLSQPVHRILGKCIRIKEHVVRLFRRLILAYYVCKSPLRVGSPSRLEIIEGVGKRFGAFRPLMFRYPLFIRDRTALVEFELQTFPSPGNLNLAAVGSYLPIFDAILEGTTNDPIFDACKLLDDAARHVLAGIILQRKDGAVSADLRELGYDGVFDPQNDSPIVTAKLREFLCTDEEFSSQLERLKINDLKEIGNQNNIKPRGAKTKSELIKAFRQALSQRRLFSQQTVGEILMPQVLMKLDELERRKLLVKPDVRDPLESLVIRYFRSGPEAPAYIAERPFRETCQRFLDTPRR
ncbi:hypothetical protein B0H19DRAFT_1253336 [Mycena capillaripes]|nr:hypothetical protein B0H19DRAFT_1253336 [Mycena capillaripes]